MVNLIGQTLLHQFRVDELVASGKMGPVYKVWDTRNNIALAMKVVNTDLIEDQNPYKHFQREAIALDDLQHPNIVPFYGSYKTSQFSFLLEYFIDGVSLREIMQINHGGLPIPEALAYMQALCSALGYAHVNGVVHSGIKTENVRVDWSGQVYLTDFMIKQSRKTGITDVDTETALYMAPEQFVANSIVPSMNIYSLGVLSFELLTGRCPFQGNESKSTTKGEPASERIRYAHLHLPPPDPKWLNPLIPSALSLIILKCLEKEPRARFATTEDILNALSGLDIAAPPRVHVPPKEKISRRINASDIKFPQNILPFFLIIFMFFGLLCVFGFYELPHWTAKPPASTGAVNNISSTNTPSIIFAETSVVPVNTSQQSLSNNSTIIPSETLSVIPTSQSQSISLAQISCSDVEKVNLRKSPGYVDKDDTKDVIHEIPCGENVELLGENEYIDDLTWWKVNWNGYDGWIADHTGKGKKILVFNQPSSFSSSDPAEFINWYLTTLWQERNYDVLWDTYLTKRFQNHSSPGGIKEFSNWCETIKHIDVHSVEVLQNDGHNAWVKIQVTFYYFDGHVLKNRSYEYDLTFESEKKIWMFDYHN